MVSPPSPVNFVPGPKGGAENVIWSPEIVYATPGSWITPSRVITTPLSLASVNAVPFTCTWNCVVPCSLPSVS